MKQSEPSAVEKLYVGVQLVRPLLRNITTCVEADLKGTGISVGQRAILEVLLLKEKATAPEITRDLQLKRQFVARELKALQANGMVETDNNPHHKKSNLYLLSQKPAR